MIPLFMCLLRNSNIIAWIMNDEFQSHGIHFDFCKENGPADSDPLKCKGEECSRSVQNNVFFYTS